MGNYFIHHFIFLFCFDILRRLPIQYLFWYFISSHHITSVDTSFPHLIKIIFIQKSLKKLYNILGVAAATLTTPGMKSLRIFDVNLSKYMNDMITSNNLY